MKALALKRNDTIAVFSPSAAATYKFPKRYKRGKEYLKKAGYRFHEGSLTGAFDFYRSGSIQERVKELNDLIQNPEIRCIMSSIGGMNSNALLPYIDYEALKKDPKIIVGYSDVTAVLLGIYAQTGIPTFYGPAVVASFGEYPPLVDQTFDYFKSVLEEGAQYPQTIKNPEQWTDAFIDWERQTEAKILTNNKLITLSEGKVTGRLIGGNLSTMMGIWGSPYMPEIKNGDILLIEDCMKDAATVERGFAFLKINGVFEKIGGLILGKHEKFNDLGTGRRPYEILLEVMGKPQIPVLAEYDCCHTHPMITLPIGGQITLDANEQSLILEESPLAYR